MLTVEGESRKRPTRSGNGMGRFIVRRLLVALPMLLVVATASFFLASALPGDPATEILGPGATDAQREQVRAQLGLDEPLLSRYFSWITRAVQGDFGNSIESRREVLTLINERLPVSLSVALLGVAVTAIVGTAIGVMSALHKGWRAKLTEFGALVGLSVPGFWLGIFLIVVFAVQLKWLPATGYVRFTSSPADWARSLVLPVTAVAAGGIAAIARQTRTAIGEVLSKDFVRTLQATGTPRRTIIVKHALRNASAPIVTVLGFQFITIFSGALIVEQVFALPGVGRLTVSAVLGRDVPLIQGIVVFAALMVMIVNLLVDVLYVALDPRLRRS